MSHRRSRLIAVGLVLAFFLPLLVRGHVISAHDNRQELALPADPDARLSNRKFFDHTSIYTPEIHHHLHGRHEGWISLWNPYPEMGRPTFQVSGNSKAYHLFHLLSLAIGNAFVLYTALTLVAVLLTVLFAHLFFEALGLSPTACLGAAAGLGLGVFSTYWLTFSLFLWTLAWTLGIAWCVTRFFQRPGLDWGLGLAFCVHSLFLSGYPQQIVLHAYFLFGLTLHRAWVAGGGWGPTVVRLLKLSAFVLLGLLTIAPVYADLVLATARSARTDTDPRFFLKVLPELSNWRDVAAYLAQLFHASWWGNPIHPNHPRPFNGVSLTPFFAVAALASLAAWRRRRLWPLQAFCALALLANTVPAVYRLGVEYAGLNISRFNPLAGMQIPLFLLVAYGIDEALASRPGRGARTLALLGGAITLLGVFAGPSNLNWPSILVGGVFLGAALLFLWRPKPALALGLSLASVAVFSFPLILSRPLGDIHLSSPLVEVMQQATADGSRFVWIGNSYGPVRSNEEALVGTPSVHTYNSLSSEAYQKWTRRISDFGTYEAGRFFTHVDNPSTLFGSEFPLTGISMVLCEERIQHERIVPVSQGIYRAAERPRLEAQLRDFHRSPGGERTTIASLEEDQPLAVLRREDTDDHIHVRTSALRQESLLFLSQEYHPHWRAMSGPNELTTVLVNGFYQGVVVPPLTGEVELFFRPHSRLAWIPQVFFLVAALGLGVGYLRRLRDAAAARDSAAAPA